MPPTSAPERRTPTASPSPIRRPHRSRQRASRRALVEDRAGMERGAEETLRAERERLRHVTELLEAAASAVEALDPEEGEGAAGLAAQAEAALAPVERLAPELARTGDELRDVEL